MSVSYICEAILERAIVGPAKGLDSATHINLQYRKNSSSHHPIKRIEKLHLVPRCRELNISFNSISRLENLSVLRQLRILNLAENCIRSIDGLEQLKLLEILDLSGNQISSIPSSISANQSLQHLRLSRNKLTSLLEFQNLSSLANLSRLDIYENPCMKIPHGRSYIIFFLPMIDVLDGESVLITDRQDASRRFDKKIVGQLQEQVRDVTSLYTESSKKLSEAEAQLHADERVLSDLKGKLEKYVQREKSQIAQVCDLEVMLERNASTISKAYSRIAELEQELSREHACSRTLKIESSLAMQLATERSTRIQAEKQLSDMENVMNHQLKIAKGLMAAKTQRFKMEEHLRSMKETADVNPWKSAAFSLLSLCESLQTELLENSGIIQVLHSQLQEIDLLVKELEISCVKRWKNETSSFNQFSNIVLLTPRQISDSQTQIKLRRLISANSRLRSALECERDRNSKNSVSKDWLSQLEFQQSQLQHFKAATNDKSVSFVRPKKTTKDSKKTQTASSNDASIATVFACREKTLLEKIKFLESELNLVTTEIDQLRSCLKSDSALKDLGDNLCHNLLSLQRSRRWAAELQSYKSQLEERDAQIQYLLGRLKHMSSSNSTSTCLESYGGDNLSDCSLNQIDSALDTSMSSFKNRMPIVRKISQRECENGFFRDIKNSETKGTLKLPCKVDSKERIEPFDKQRFLTVIERLKEESNI